MTITEFEQQLKEIDPKFEIVQHPNNPELAGVYYDRNIENKTGFVITVPSKEIHEKFNPSYTDTTGHPHNSAEKVIFVCKDHLNKLATNAEYKSLFYERLK